jgi:hypothetical protein
MLIKRRIGNDGVLEEAESVAMETAPDVMARRVYNMVTSGAAEPNKPLPASMFAAGVRTIRGANDLFTQKVIAASRPVAARSGFDRSGLGDWLLPTKSRSLNNAAILALQIGRG